MPARPKGPAPSTARYFEETAAERWRERGYTVTKDHGSWEVIGDGDGSYARQMSAAYVQTRTGGSTPTTSRRTSDDRRAHRHRPLLRGRRLLQRCREDPRRPDPDGREPLGRRDHHARAEPPGVDHDIADLSQVDPRRYPRTKILWASPSCTNHTQAKGVARALQVDEWNPYDGRPLPKEAAERSRATMWDVPRFAEFHRYAAVIVENVVEPRSGCSSPRGCTRWRRSATSTRSCG